MYNLINYIATNGKVSPEDMRNRLIWLPTERLEGGDFNVAISLVEPVVPQIFETKRSMTDLLKFGEYIKSTVREMEEYAKNRL